ncbi:ribosomal 5S rRNA E-loop binding protein Ctc/L25/TL5 [mine drainage metagenome]|uniref:Ribosomal 5S rRNA E-loop binding protein Ctc/L25/TL5 n=1 Tax=mine drainage metagenome TaxID=410659 RepID=T0ZWL6_9ZZZZ
MPLSLEAHELGRHLADEAFYSSILEIRVGETKLQGVLKDLQRHPVKGVPIHVDLQRVQADQVIRMHVPLHFQGEASVVGVKQGGGVLSKNLIEVEVACLPKDLPEFLVVDVTQLEIGQAIHLSQIPLPEGVSLVQLLHGTEHDLPVVAVHHARVTQATEETAAPETPAETPLVGEEKSGTPDQA